MSKYHFEDQEKINHFLIKYDFSNKIKDKHTITSLNDYKEWSLLSGEIEEHRGNYYQVFNYIKRNYLKNTFSYKGVSGYIGVVSLLDAEIENIIPIERVYSNCSHHCRFLPTGDYERVENGESSLFIVIKGRVAPYFLCKIPNDILSKIQEQISVI